GPYGPLGDGERGVRTAEAQQECDRDRQDAGTGSFADDRRRLARGRPEGARVRQAVHINPSSRKTPGRTWRCRMKIVVVGGSVRVGSTLVTMLTRDGHQVVAASRRSGVDVVTGEGLADTLSGASVVVDVSNSPSFEDAAVMKFFKTTTQNLLDGEAAA